MIGPQSPEEHASREVYPEQRLQGRDEQGSAIRTNAAIN